MVRRMCLAALLVLSATALARPGDDERQRLLAREKALNNELAGLFRDKRTQEALPKAEELLALRRKLHPADHIDVARSLVNLGRLQLALGLRDKGRAHFQEALPIYRKAQPPQHAELVRSLYELGTSFAQSQQPASARPLLAEALALRDKLDAKEFPHVSQIRFALGLATSDLGSHDEGERHLRAALADFRKVLPAGHRLILHAEVSLGVLRLTQGRPEEGKRLLEQILTEARKHHPGDNADVAIVLYWLASALSDLGQTDQAQRVLEEALAMQRRVLPAGHQQTGATLTRLGTTLTRGRHPDRGRAYLEQAVALFRRAKPQPTVSLANALSSLATCWREMGQSDAALPLLEEALALHRTASGDSVVTARALANLGVILHQLDRGEAARDTCAEALAMARRHLARGDPELAWFLHELARVEDFLGRVAEARRLAEEALALLRQQKPPSLRNLGVALDRVARLCHVEGKTDEARRYFEEALEVWGKAVPQSHPSYAGALQNFGWFQWKQGEKAAAWEKISQANEGLVRFQHSVLPGLPPHDQFGVVLRYRYALNALLRMAAQGAELTESRRRELAWHLFATKSLRSLARQQREEALLASKDEGTRRMVEELKGLRRQTAEMLLRTADRAADPAYRARCVELDWKRRTLEQALAQRLRDWPAEPGNDPAQVDELARALAPGTVLAEAILYPSHGEGGRLVTAYAVVLLWRTDEGQVQVRHVDLGVSGPVEMAVGAWRDAAERGRAGAAAERELVRRVWQPLARVLPAGTKRLLVAPDGHLALVPFEALRLEDGSYLIERYAVSYLTTGRDLLLPKRAAAAKTAVVLADPAYDALPERPNGGAAPAKIDHEQRGAVRFGRLPGFAREADRVARLLGEQAGWKTQSLAGEQADEERLAEVKSPRLLYLITHGFFLGGQRGPAGKAELRDLELVGAGPPPSGQLVPRLDARLRHGLALAGANRWADRLRRGASDGWLTALEVESLDLTGTELVVLSACETGLGLILPGDSVLGLRQAFQQAGARTVLASLWKVPDAETERLMSDTLSRWLKGAPPHEALREAQLAMIRHLRESGARNGKQGEAAPLYWAGFVCHGR